MYLSIVRENMNVFVCGYMHESIVISWQICRMYLIIVDNEYAIVINHSEWYQRVISDS